MAKNASPILPQAPKGINLVYVALGVLLFLGIMLFVTSRTENRGQSAKEEVVEDGQISFETVHMARVSGYKERVYFTVNTQEEWQKVWGEINAGAVAPPALPTVDFSKEMLVLVFQGSQSNGGYSIEVTGVEKEEEVVGVAVKEVSPGASCFTTQVITAPLHVVKIPKVDAKFEYEIKYERTECSR